MKNVSRREFLKGAAAGAAGMAALGLSGAVSAAEGDRFIDSIEWNAVYDVVVIGFGAGGAASAITAADDGAKVLLIEKAPRGQEGGDSIFSGQVVMGVDPEHVEDLKKYFIAMCDEYTDYDEECFQVMAEGCAENLDWLVSLGADRDAMMVNYGDTKGYRMVGSGYVWNENPQLEGSGYNLGWVVGTVSSAGSYYYLLHDNVTQRENITVWYSAPAKHLIQDPTTKTIVGVQLEKDGKTVNVLAKNGVIMALGGYEANQKMMGSYLQRPRCNVLAGRFNTGDGINMAIEVGADLWHMSNSAGFIWSYQVDNMPQALYPFTVKNGILVGPGGTRFMNEAASNRHGRIDIGGRWIQTPYPNPTHLIMDADAIAKYALHKAWSAGNVEEIEKGWIKKADTIEELAAAINVSYENLQATIDKYNAAYDNGIDADFARPFSTIVPIKTAPFYYLEVGPTMYNTQGGPRRNAKAEVVNPSGQPIPHLYSSGDCGAIWPDMYNGSGNLGECGVFGRISGHNAAAVKNDILAEGEEIAVVDLGIVDEPYVYETEENEYIGKARGKGGDLVAKVTIVEGKIESIMFVQNNETMRWSDRAFALVPKAIIEAQSVEVDGAAGATRTSDAIKKAVAQALEASKN